MVGIDQEREVGQVWHVIMEGGGEGSGMVCDYEEGGVRYDCRWSGEENQIYTVSFRSKKKNLEKKKRKKTKRLYV